MTYEVVCPKGHRLQVTEAHFGEQVSCPTCGEAFVVPDVSEQRPSGDSQEAADDSSAPSKSSATGRLTAISRVAGRPMLAVGLLLVLVSRGCDAIGKRSVDRSEAKSQIAQTRFDDQWEEKRAGHQLRIKDIEREQEKERNEDAPDYVRISQLSKDTTELQEKITKSREDQQKARELLELGEWRELKTAADNAAANNKINAYWRAIFFVFATVVLALGLLAVSWTAEGAERWVCLIMLAIITFSIYIAGTAWTGFPV